MGGDCKPTQASRSGPSTGCSFSNRAVRRLLLLAPNYRDSAEPLVTKIAASLSMATAIACHPDTSVFKADSSSVAIIYDQTKEVVCYRLHDFSKA